MMTCSRRTVVFGALLAVTGLLTGCQQAASPVPHRPSIQEVIDRDNKAVDAVKALVDNAYPGATWEHRGEPSIGAGGRGGVYAYSTIWYSDARLADDEKLRDELVAQASVAVRDFGFGDFLKVEAKPGAFSYVSGDAYGGELHFGGGTNITIRYSTGEHPES